MLDRDTLGLTPADLLAASMAAIEQALIGLETGTYHATTHHLDHAGRRSTD